MSSALGALLSRPRVTLSIAFMLALMGVTAWLTMPRLEDPEMSDRWASIIVRYPGADPATVERTVVAPMEEELSEVAEIKKIDSTARAGVAIFALELTDDVDVSRIDRIWDHVEEQMRKAKREFPSGVGEPELDRDQSDPEAVVLALTGADLASLSKAADQLERELLRMGSVSRVTRIGDADKQITIDVDPAVMRSLGLTRRQLSSLLASRHNTLPAGLIELDGRTATLRPDAEFHSVEELSATPVPLASGAAVALGDVAKIQLGTVDPVGQRMRHNGAMAVGLGIVPKRPLDLVKFGEHVRARIDELRPQLAPIEIHEVAFQPDHVSHRLQDLGMSLLQSIAIVGALLMLMMGVRMGVLVASVVPLVSLSALGLYAAGGGVLHQMSIAALVIAIGMLVDNAIVVAEAVQARLDQGASRADAMRETVSSLAVPLGTATGTTVAAFVPMLLSKGPVAEFTMALPIVISLTLILSYVFALFVTPVLAAALKPSVSSDDHWMSRLGGRAGRIAVGNPKTVLLGAALAVGAALMAAPYVEQNFFPGGDRATLIVDLSLPEGSDIDRIDGLAARLERALEAREDVVQVSSFIGRGTPHFYYNLWTFPHSPHRAQLVVNTRSMDTLTETQAWVRAYARRELPELTVVAKKLEQGPGVAAPIEVRVYADDLVDQARTIEKVLLAVTESRGTLDVRHTMGTGVPSVRVHVDDASAARHGLSRSDVVLALLGETHGLEIGQLRSGKDPIPVLVRAPQGRRTAVDLLDSVSLGPNVGSDLPLSEVAASSVEWLPAVIQHRGQRRVASVLAELDEGATFTSVMRDLGPKLEQLELPPGVRVELGGVGENASDANNAMLLALPFGALMLITFLLIEFNSFRRVGIVLVTIPLAAIGVIPGLLIGKQPFGFMSTLGVTALAGVVVNNAIVLLDLADKLREAGASIEEATREAVRARARPILLTSGTTVVGLIPLAISQSSLWPPLAWAMMFGLTASTLLTLLVVPALYVMLMKPRFTGKPAALAAAASALVATTLSVGVAGAQATEPEPAPALATPDAAIETEEPPLPEFDLEREIISDTGLTAEEAAARAVARAPQVASAQAAAVSAHWDARALWSNFLPQVQGFAQYKRIKFIRNSLDFGFDPSAIEDPELRAVVEQLTEGLGGDAGQDDFTQPRNNYSVGANARIPVSEMLLRFWPAYESSKYVAQARKYQAEAASWEVEQRAKEAFYQYALALANRAVFQQALKQAEAQRDQVQLFVEAGTVAPVDLMSASARYENARSVVARAEGRVAVARNMLATLMGVRTEDISTIREDVTKLPPDLQLKEQELVERGLERRPELKALRALVGASDLQRKAERGAAFPQLAVEGNVLHAQPNPRYIPVNRDHFRNSWEIGAILSWSPNQSLVGYQRSQRASAEMARARADVIALEDAVRIEVVQALEDFRAAEAAAQASRAQLEAAEEAYRVRLATYRVGATTFVDLLQDDLRVTEARLALVNDAINARVALARLQRAAVLD